MGTEVAPQVHCGVYLEIALPPAVTLPPAPA